MEELKSKIAEQIAQFTTNADKHLAAKMHPTLFTISASPKH